MCGSGRDHSDLTVPKQSCRETDERVMHQPIWKKKQLFTTGAQSCSKLYVSTVCLAAAATWIGLAARHWTAELWPRLLFSHLLWLLTLFTEVCAGSFESVILLSEIQMQESGKLRIFWVAKQCHYYRCVFPSVNALYFQLASVMEDFKRDSVLMWRSSKPEVSVF